MILTEAEAREAINRVLKAATADEVRINLDGSQGGNTRFALNSITTSGDADTLSVSVTARFGKRQGTAQGTELDDAGLMHILRTAEELARVAPEDPESVPELPPQHYLSVDPYVEATARATPEVRARSAAAAIGPAQSKELVAAGFFTHDHSSVAIGNSKGLFGYYRSTWASYSVTVRNSAGTASGWDSVDSRDIARIDYLAASKRAVEKAEASKDAQVLQPGVYPVILEPAAVAEFASFALWSMDAREADEGQSYFSKPGGGNRIGQRIVGKNITVRSDPTHPDLLGSPFNYEGLPAARRTWIESGVLRQLYYSRYWAQKHGKEATGFPENIVIEGGNASLDDLIRDTERAILVTRFWYTNFVDPQTVLVTGLTRDGTFLVEKGRIQHAVKNFRFNESPITVLNKVTGMTKPVRVGDSLVPAIRASAFTFSSLSDAV